ncbi:MAG: hypothetical protein IJW13_00650 [Clostridia bacterium]|nr:hypothetical protein [Clostridia bacterium]
MSTKHAQFIRILTAPCLIALALVCILAVCDDSFFSSYFNMGAIIFCLSVLPASAYLFVRIKKCEDKVTLRNKERHAAMLFSAIGYILGGIFIFVFPTNQKEKALMLTYVFSMIITVILNYAFKFKSSAHTCAFSGPIAILCHRVSPFFAILYAILIPIITSSLKLKRHTVAQLIVGIFIPIVAMVFALLIVPYIPQ